MHTPFHIHFHAHTPSHTHTHTLHFDTFSSAAALPALLSFASHFLRFFCHIFSAIIMTANTN